MTSLQNVWRHDDLPGVELWRFPGSKSEWKLRHWAYAFCIPEDEQTPPLSYWYRHETWTLIARSIAWLEPGAVQRSQGSTIGAFLVLMLDSRLVEADVDTRERLRQAPHQFGDAQYAALSALTSLLRDERSTPRERRCAFDDFMASLPKGAPGASDTRRAAVRESVAVVRARRVLEEHLADALELDDLARASGLSKFYLLRTFNRKVGVSPFEYRRLVRLGRALELLRGGAEPAQVSAETGFADQSHLTRSLRKTLGITPGKYRGIDGRP